MSELSCRSEVIVPATESSAEVGKLKSSRYLDDSSYISHINISLPVQTKSR